MEIEKGGRSLVPWGAGWAEVEIWRREVESWRKEVACVSVRVGDLVSVLVIAASGDASVSFAVETISSFVGVSVSSFFKAGVEPWVEPGVVKPSGRNGVDVAAMFPDIVLEPAPVPVEETISCPVPIPVGVGVSGCW